MSLGLWDVANIFLNRSIYNITRNMKSIFITANESGNYIFKVIFYRDPKSLDKQLIYDTLSVLEDQFPEELKFLGVEFYIKDQYLEDERDVIIYARTELEDF